MINYKILGICKKAGKLRQGTDTLNYLLEKNLVVLVLFSDKISENSYKKIINKIKHYNIDYLKVEDDLLNKELGTKNAKVVSITDIGFKNIILKN